VSFSTYLLAVSDTIVDAITVRTKVVLVDDTPNFEPEPLAPDPFGAQKPLHNTQIVQLPAVSASARSLEDPLNDDVYLKIHGKNERHEKQMKNSDRERAQHEKYQLEKLLEDLRGPDWLKTLGITGITDTEKKRYEPKRRLFIRETQALIEKFKRWKEEERRRKQEREEAMHQIVDEEEDLDDDSNEEIPDSVEAESVTSASTHAPNSSELDALASQQLISEAKIANKRKPPSPPKPIDPPPPKPFVSFFEKKHIRDAAVAGRQRGRTILAFGLPVPDWQEADFDLPEHIRTDELIIKRQRNSRRLRRGDD
jgi:hypothetical protein